MSEYDNIDLKDLLSKFNLYNGKSIILLIIVLIFLFSSFFTVGPDEAGIIIRLGKYHRTVDSGLHFKMPFGIESKKKVAIKQQKKEEFGFRTIKAGVRTQYSTSNYKHESLMLTGDLNAAEISWIVQYKINDPYNYLFKVRNVNETFRNLNEAIMREVIGDRSVTEVLTTGRQQVATAATERLQDVCNQYEMGIKISQVILQDATAPDKVKPAFNEVNEAQQEKEKLINQAKSEYNKFIPKARGEAEKLIEEAKGYALERVNRAKGEASKFNSIYKEYMKAKEVTRQRIYLETMNEVLQNVGKKLITDEDATGILPLYQLNKEGAIK